MSTAVNEDRNGEGAYISEIVPSGVRFMTHPRVIGALAPKTTRGSDMTFGLMNPSSKNGILDLLWQLLAGY